MNVALRYAARSDVGLVRANNQDSGYAGPHLLMVADGMGGHAGGDVASSVTVAALAPLDDEAHGSDEALDVLSGALATAKAEIIARTEADPDLAGMGTTVTAILRSGNKLAMVHLGDSRGYLLRDGELTQVTTDHTFVQHLVDSGRITPEEAEHHPQRSVVMRVLGDFELALSPDLSMREARPGDRWMLCSDGLSGFVSADTIAETLRNQTDVEVCADRLIQLALRAGGGDNVTAIVADVVDLDEVPDGHLPTTDPQVVGSAATSRNLPTSATDGPAARAGALVSGNRTSDEDLTNDEEAAPQPRRRAGLFAVWIAGVLLIAGGLIGAYTWTQTQYFVGVDSGYVAISQGVPAEVGPISLNHVVERSALKVEDLPPYLRERVGMTIDTEDLATARQVVADLNDEARTPSTEQGPSSPSVPVPATETPTPAPADPATEPETSPEETPTGEA